MTQELFYCKQFVGDKITLNESESKHCSQVLRKKPGDEIILTDGAGAKVTGTLISVHKRECLVQVSGREIVQPLYPYKVTIGIGTPSHPQRTEWLVEKLTELGVNEIIFLNTQHVQFPKVKKERLEKVAISALKQSLKFHLPEIQVNVPYNEFLKIWEATDKDKTGFIGSCLDGRKTVKSVFTKSNHYFLLIGPEGDFSLKEYQMADESGLLQISLGKSRLRVETAAISLLNAVHLLY